MRGGNSNNGLQEYGILTAYERALQHDNFELAEKIIQANPQVSKAQFEKVFKEVTGVNVSQDEE